MKMDFCMERVSFLTTIACNLNCKLCAASSPYRAGEAGFSLEENKNVLDKFFQTVDYVKKKELKRVPHAAPGYVIYHTNYSIMVEPRKEISYNEA